MINEEKIYNFVQNIEILNHSNYEKIIGRIFTEFKGFWLDKVIVSYLIYEKFNKEYEDFIELTKETLKANRPFPDYYFQKDFIAIIEALIPLFSTDPKLFQFIIPLHPYSLTCLYKAKSASHIFDYYKEELIKEPESYTNALIEYKLLPENLFGVLYYENDTDFQLKVNSEFYNSVFYRFDLNKIEYRCDFIPELVFYTKEELSHHLTENKGNIHPPIIKEINKKMIPVNINLGGGVVWYKLNLKGNNRDISLPLNIDFAEIIEGVVTLDPLSLFKVLNAKEEFKDAEEIVSRLKNKKNHSLCEILDAYYNEKYENIEGMKIKGSEIYKSFINSDDFIISENELDRFNHLIQSYNISPDKVNFIIFYERLKNKIPTITKPILGVQKLLGKLKEKMKS